MESGTLENPKIELLMDHLAVKLKTVSGKKQYGYLKTPLKAVVDEIVDELAKDPRVVQAYDLWYQMREEVLRTYKDDLPRRLPLSQQKEFKQIRNLVIREAVRLGELRQETSLEEAGTGGEERSIIQDAVCTMIYPHPAAKPPDPAVLQAVTRLLRHMANIFREQEPRPVTGPNRFTDKKLRRRIQEKKIAMGHKPDDHEPTITM